MSPRTACCVDAASLKNRRQGSLPPILRLGAVEGRRSGFTDSIASLAPVVPVVPVVPVAPVAPVASIASVPVFVDFSCLTPALAHV